MLSFVARRLALAVPTLILVSLFTFSLQKLLPGDPVLVLAGEERSPEVLQMLRHKYHLDDPAPVQYLHWVGGVLHGDLGVSLKTDQPVAQLIGQKLPITIELAVLAMGIALLVGIPLGVIAAVCKGTGTDLAANVVALAGISVPSFWLGVLMILLFAVKLHWLPASGFVPPWEDPVQNIRTMLMPSLVIGAALAASLMRHTRGAMLAVLRADYIRTARAKGLLSPAVILKHAFRNALVPIVTLVTLLFGELIGGAVLTEQVFTIPGFGKMIVDAVFTRELRGGAGRGALRRLRLCGAEPARRRALRAGQPAHEGRGMTDIAAPARAVPRRPHGRALSAFLRNRTAVAGAAVDRRLPRPARHQDIPRRQSPITRKQRHPVATGPVRGPLALRPRLPAQHPG